MDELEPLRALLRACGYRQRLGDRREQWSHPVTRRAILIITMRHEGRIRLCAERVGEYAAGLPPALRERIKRGMGCSGDCVPWGGGKPCPGGWRFELDGERYVKCRYNEFAFTPGEADMDELELFLRRELIARGELLPEAD